MVRGIPHNFELPESWGGLERAGMQQAESGENALGPWTAPSHCSGLFSIPFTLHLSFF